MTALATDPGELSLDKLLSTLTTTVDKATFVFATVTDLEKVPPLSHCQLFFREKEGFTVITTLEYATAHGLDYFFKSRMITCNVTSSLEAVGFMAVLATKLAANGIGVNPVSGFYHDHIFVPLGREDEAISILNDVARSKRDELGNQ